MEALPQETPLHLISNQGVGRVPDELIEKARSDPMNFSFGGFSAVRDWAFGVVKGQDRSGFARASAIRELKRFATTESAEALLTLTNEPDREIMHAAIETLAILGADCPMAEAYYQSLLSDLDVARRASAILSLAERPMTPEIITALGDLMEQSNLQLRWAAIYALAKSCGGYPEIHSILMRHTYEPDYELRRFVDTAQHRELGWCCQEK